MKVVQKTFQEELPERNRAAVGEAYYEVDRDYISIQTHSFSQFICTSCNRYSSVLLEVISRVAFRTIYTERKLTRIVFFDLCRSSM